VTTSEGSDAILSRLRDLSDPESTGMEVARQGGGVYSPGTRPASRGVRETPKSHAKDRTLYHAKVASFVKNSVDVTAQAVLAADRRHIRLSLNPAFNTAGVGPARIVNPVFPGGGVTQDK
jgi:hypothetical protein